MNPLQILALAGLAAGGVYAYKKYSADKGPTPDDFADEQTAWAAVQQVANEGIAKGKGSRDSELDATLMHATDWAQAHHEHVCAAVKAGHYTPGPSSSEAFVGAVWNELLERGYTEDELTSAFMRYIGTPHYDQVQPKACA